MATTAPTKTAAAAPRLEDDPLWYKDAVFYELHVRAFKDSNADGIGDFRGLTERLDYLQDLGVDTLWLLPFYPSPLRDDGYDIAEYTEIHPSYGTMRDFREFLREAHRRGLRVVTELVINHTSDQHPWFQRARRARKGSAARDFYVWSDQPDRYLDARIIFKDFETSNWAWDPVAQAYYWHRFYSHQPDLNFDNPAVHKALLQVLDFWMKLGVDGMRLDAIPYLYEREGTNCENLPETHAFLKKIRAHVDSHFRNRMLLAEANQWPEDTVPYFGQGDECNMAFHFPVMPRLFMAIRMEDRFPIIDILRQTPPIPPNCQWGIFLRNHDELTLEMVTEEERDYMYRIYAADPRARINLGIRRRLAPLLGNDRRSIELMNSLLFSLPGTPVLYYGDEIGMGDNIYLGDRNGVRTPMQWSGDRNAGFSRANPQSLYLPVITDPEYHYEAVNVEAQERNPNSLLSWTKRLISLRRRFKAFGRGDIEFLLPENRKVLAFIRSYEDERILVVVNLSRSTQHVSLDLSAYEGLVPIELFGWTPFPRITREPLFLTLSPHVFFWFALSPEAEREHLRVAAPRPRRRVLALPRSWRDAFTDGHREHFEDVLPTYLGAQRWFRSKARAIRLVTLTEAIPLDADSADAFLAIVRVEFTDGEAEDYVLPLAFAAGPRAERLEAERAAAIVARVRIAADGTEGVIYDAVYDEAFLDGLLEMVAGRRRIHGARGAVVASTTPVFRRLTRGVKDLEPRLVGVEQSNTSVAYGDRVMLKLYRRLEEGVSLDLEIGRFLTDRGYPNAPAVAGAIEYASGIESRTLAVLNEYCANEGDAWALAVDKVATFLEDLPSHEGPLPEVHATTRWLLERAMQGPTPAGEERIGGFLEEVRLLGRRTAELHATLASAPSNPAFAPEPFTLFYQRSLYQSMRNLVGQVWLLLDRTCRTLPEPLQAQAERLLDLEDQVLRRFRGLIEGKIAASRIRTHGDYHLGQVLYTGRDFIITDFEGEPIRALGERRLKRSALRDVAGMLRSFHYAAMSRFYQGEAGPAAQVETGAALAAAEFWYAEVAAAFLGAYLAQVPPIVGLPPDPLMLERLLDVYLIEKVVYEVGYELNNRPSWLAIPLSGALHLLGA
ncbi:MAG: maltose alpha-D-glucosyltransferase [Gemmatimonadetes bacterium]|nr:maltose alpha-D-glucosyltransferase [Gemmatimonadota bacterium]